MKRFATRILLGLLIISSTTLLGEIITTLQKNDPAPLWSTYFPLDFLLAGRKAFYKGVSPEPFPETFSLSISPFYQKANRGRDFEGDRVLLSDLEGRWNMVGLLYGGIPDTVGALLGEAVPSTQQLGNAKAAIFSDLVTENPPGLGANPNTIIDQQSNQKYLLDDQCKRVGYFSVPIRYRKTGLRFEMQISPIFDFGITVRGGVAEIKQTYSHLIDRIPQTGCCTDIICTPSQITRTVDCCPKNVDTARIPADFLTPVPTVLALEPNNTGCNANAPCQPRWLEVENQLMDPFEAERIFRQIGLDPCNFRETSIEDTYISAWFRHAFPVNVWGNGPVDPKGNGRLTNCITCAGDRTDAIYNDFEDTRAPLSYHVDTGCGDLCADTSYCYDYTAFLFIPFVSFNAALPTAKKQDRSKLFSLPFGNDGHTGIGMDAGFDFDFYETVEFGMEAGFMRWNCREIRADTDTDNVNALNPLYPPAHRWFTGFRLPSQPKQSGIFPFGTTVQRRPGTNYHFSLVLSAFRFLCNLSGFAQFVFISHAEDRLFIPNPTVNNPVINVAGSTLPPVRLFRTDLAECRSKFESRVFNTGLNYEIGENFSLGLLVQWPVYQRNAYRSTTYMGSLRLIF